MTGGEASGAPQKTQSSNVAMRQDVYAGKCIHHLSYPKQSICNTIDTSVTNWKFANCLISNKCWDIWYNSIGVNLNLIARNIFSPPKLIFDLSLNFNPMEISLWVCKI